MIDLDHLFERDGLSRADTLGVYLIGSRAHGTAGPASDHDLIVVARPHRRRWRGMTWLVREGWVPPDPPRDRGARRDFIGDQEHQIWLFDAPTFTALRDAHVPLALECLDLPPAQVWLGRHDLRAGFTLDRDRLQRAFTWVADRHVERSRRAHEALSPADDPTPARKLLVHALRILKYGIQLAERGAIVDYGAANALRRAILSDPAPDWSALFARVQPTHDELRAALARACARPS